MCIEVKVKTNNNTEQISNRDHHAEKGKKLLAYMSLLNYSIFSHYKIAIY